MLLRLLTSVVLLCTLCSSCELELYWPNSTTLPFLKYQNYSISKRVSDMTLEEKVGQLFLLQSSAQSACEEDDLYRIIQSGKVGSLILEDYSVEDYTRIAARCNQFSKIPLLYGTNENVTLNNQFSDAIAFPKAATISAISNTKIRQEVRQLYIDQCRALGIQLSLGVPLFNDEKNVEHYDLDDYGELDSINLVHQKELIQSLSKHYILSGGNSSSSLSLINNSGNKLNSSDLETSRALVSQGLSAVVVDKQMNAKLSIHQYVPQLLKNYLHYGIGFDGFVFSNVSTKKDIQESLYNGADVLIVEEEMEFVFQTTLQLMKEGAWSEKMLNHKVEKILKAKNWTKNIQHKNVALNTKKIEHLLFHPHFEEYVKSCYQESVVLANNKSLPFKNLHQNKFQVIHFEDVECVDLVERMRYYGDVEATSVSLEGKPSALKNAAARLTAKPTSIAFNKILKNGYSKIVVVDRDISQLENYVFDAIMNLAKKEALTIINFGNPHQIRHFSDSNIIHAFEQNQYTEEFIAELLFGGQTANGEMIVDVSPLLTAGTSIQTPITRLNYSTPESLGMNAEELNDISEVVESAIRKKAIPGCQVLIAKKGSVIYHKTFGHHTYDEKLPVQKDDLYDLASLTKTTATTLATMKLYEEGRLDLEDNMEHCFGEKCGSRMKNIRIKNLLLHTSRLQANMPIYSFIHRMGVTGNECNPFYCSKKRNNYRTQIANHFYINDQVKSELIDDVLGLKLYKSKRYRYSDVNFNLLQQIIEEETKLPLDNYIYQNFYTPMNLKHCLYKPTTRYYKTKIIPTARDRNWRNQLLDGFVHDESAALLGGVGGNAGLFSNAEDLAILYQMLLNGGSYGGNSFLKPETIELFTKKQNGSNRGLGFDKPRKTKYPSYSAKASKQSFGHTGFTGTAVWVDPVNELIYVFLSNRIHPKPNNTKLFKYKTRKKIHDVVYKAFDTHEVKLPSFNDKI